MRRDEYGGIVDSDPKKKPLVQELHEGLRLELRVWFSGGAYRRDPGRRGFRLP